MSSAPSTNREQVFCHQCERDWYRDEHGLTCPTCQSDFVEIIENDDPRDDLHIGDLGDLALDPPIWDPEEHSSTAGQGARTDDGETDSPRWTATGPNSWTYRNTIQSPASSPNTNSNNNQTSGFPLSGILGSVFGMLNGATQTQPIGPNGSRSYTYHSPSGNAHFSVTTSTSGNFGPLGFAPRNPSSPGPPEFPIQQLNQLFQVFGGPPGSPPGGGQRGFDNNTIFDILMGGQLGGQYAHSQQDFDRIITQLMEQTQAASGAPAATETAIENLPKKAVDKAMLGDSGKAECTICMAEVDLGEVVTELYCKHWFHADCIKAWLEQHNTCPHCRKSIEEGKVEADRKAGIPPSAGSSTSPPHSHPTSTFSPNGAYPQSPFFMPGQYPQQNQPQAPPIPPTSTRPTGPGHSIPPFSPSAPLPATHWRYASTPPHLRADPNSHPQAQVPHDPSARRQYPRRSRSGEPMIAATRRRNTVRERSYERRDYERRRRSDESRARQEEEEQPGILQRARDWLTGHGSGSGGNS